MGSDKWYAESTPTLQLTQLVDKANAATARATAAEAQVAEQAAEIRSLRAQVEQEREALAMAVAEMSRARGRLEIIAGCNEDRRIAAALGSTCDHVRRTCFPAAMIERHEDKEPRA